MESTIIELQETDKEFISLSLNEDGTQTISYYHKWLKDGYSHDYDNELIAWKCFQALKKVIFSD